jgi:hypothetical protein
VYSTTLSSEYEAGEVKENEGKMEDLEINNAFGKVKAPPFKGFLQAQGD